MSGLRKYPSFLLYISLQVELSGLTMTFMNIERKIEVAERFIIQDMTPEISKLNK